MEGRAEAPAVRKRKTFGVSPLLLYDASCGLRRSTLAGVPSRKGGWSPAAVVGAAA